MMDDEKTVEFQPLMTRPMKGDATFPVDVSWEGMCRTPPTDWDMSKAVEVMEDPAVLEAEDAARKAKWAVEDAEQHAKWEAEGTLHLHTLSGGSVREGEMDVRTRLAKLREQGLQPGVLDFGPGCPQGTDWDNPVPFVEPDPEPVDDRLLLAKPLPIDPRLQPLIDACYQDGDWVGTTTDLHALIGLPWETNPLDTYKEFLTMVPSLMVGLICYMQTVPTGQITAAGEHEFEIEIATMMSRPIRRQRPGKPARF